MSTTHGVIELDLFISRSPDSVRAWWTDLPDDYRATDPREQPYRVVTQKYTGDGRQLLCYWRSPDGSERQTRETLHLREDGSWAFDVEHPAGYSILDEFKAVPQDGRTRLEVRSKIVPKTPSAEAKLESQREAMIKLWKAMVDICERDAPETGTS